jgi:hypothetical protein
MKRVILLILFVLFCSSFRPKNSFTGTWEFRGGIYNDKIEGPPEGYVLQRKYTQTSYAAFLLEKGLNPYKYEEGNYRLVGDTCIDTQTFSSEPSKITGIPIHYLYTIAHDTLKLTATLPTGLRVQEYWKKIKMPTSK